MRQCKCLDERTCGEIAIYWSLSGSFKCESQTLRPADALHQRWRFVHYPLPFVVGGENFSWEVPDERVREGEVIRLPDPAVRAEYQPIGHPARPGYRDVRGTLTIIRVGPRDMLVDVQVASDAAGWRLAKRIRYARRPTPRMD